MQNRQRGTWEVTEKKNWLERNCVEICVLISTIIMLCAVAGVLTSKGL